jgi:hypothetical protein
MSGRRIIFSYISASLSTIFLPYLTARAFLASTLFRIIASMFSRSLKIFYIVLGLSSSFKFDADS